MTHSVPLSNIAIKAVLPTIPQIVASTEMIAECGGRRIVQVDDVIVKYGQDVQLKQAESTSFVASHTTIPVPRILSTMTDDGTHYIIMTRLSGTPLSECIRSLSEVELDIIACELKGYVNQLRRLRIEDYEERCFIGSVGGGVCMDKIFRAGTRSAGPFDTEGEMNNNICERWQDLFSWGNKKQDNYIYLLRQMYQDSGNHAIRFAHGDLSPCNILIENGRVTGILDWEEAGWYPEYWEYIKAMQGCAGIWDTLWPLQIEKFLHPYHYERLIDLEIRRRLA